MMQTFAGKWNHRLAQSGPTEALVDQTAWAAADKVAATHTILKHV